MHTFTGRRFWPLDPRPEDVCVEDIAHALALQTRFGGHCLRFYSVAEHCVHLARAASPDAALWLLLHDGSEAYLSDMVRPLKRHMPEYRAIEDRVAWVVYEAFDLDPGMEPAEVKERDCRILIDERAQVMLSTGEAWHYGGATEPLGVTLQFWTPEQAEREFLATFAELTGRPFTIPASAAPRADSAERTAGDVRMILARLWCQAEGNDPDDTISDAGHTVLDGLLGGLDRKAMAEIEKAERAVLASAPAATSGVPDSVRALSEAATKGEWYTESEKCDGSYGSGEDSGEGYLAYSILTDAERPYGNPGVIAETSNSTLGVIHEDSHEDGHTAWDETARANTAFIVAAVNHVRALIAARPAGQAGDAGADARTVMTEACKPWEHYTGEPPDDGSPLSGVFVAGMVYTERLLAKLLDVTHYEGGDGSEDFDNDATQTLRNILTGAGLWDSDENRAVKPAPDSTRTGAETEDLFNAIDRMGQYAPTTAVNQLQRLAEAALAARPEAPSDAGWVKLLGDLDDLACAKVCQAAALISEDRDTYKDGYHNGIIQMAGDFRSAIRKAVPNFDALFPTPPSDPAPSGQAEG